MPQPPCQERSTPSCKTSRKRFKNLSKNTSKRATYVHRKAHTPPPSSSSKRKMDDSNQSRITDDWTNGRYATDTPSLSSVNSSHVSKKHLYSPNLTYDGDTTMYASKKATNGRPHSSQIKACSNQKSCSLASPTPQPHSKPWWMPYLQKNYTKTG